MKVITSIVLLILLISCGSEEVKEKTAPNYLVIKPFVADSTNELEDPIFYGDHNFILADSKNIYYHNNSGYYRGMCGTGIDFTKPPYLCLTPDSLQEISQKDLLNFLKTITKKTKEYLLVSISSPVDTIRNKSVFTIRDFFKNKKKTYLGIRKFTEEEQYVLQAKLTNKAYDPKEIKWKNGFSIGAPQWRSIQFIPLEVQ